MRFFNLLAAFALLVGALSAQAASGRIIKLLPHYLDKEGRHTLSPSLYERDAYQAHLRSNPDEVSGIRFDFKWRASSADRDKLRMRIEIRGSKTQPGNPFVIEQAIKRKGLFGRWASVTIEKEAFDKVGKMIAWQATLLEDNVELAQQRSFLWSADSGKKDPAENSESEGN